MVDPALMDPLGVMTAKNKQLTPVEAYRNAIIMAKKFHDNLRLYAHPETYGYYGTDNSKYRSFGHVSWLCWQGGKHGAPKPKTNFIVRGLQEAMSERTRREHFKTAQQYAGISKSGWGYAIDGLGKRDVFGALPVIPFWLSEERNMPGDGTVPTCSGEMLNKLTPPLQEVFGIPGYDHQGSFDDAIAYRATIYCIARIIQKAAPKSC
jgi:hypothetical protein